MKHERIFSGPSSKTLWKLVNEAKTTKGLQEALHYACCCLAELETIIYEMNAEEQKKGYQCNDCDCVFWKSELLEAPNPFDANKGKIYGCPCCKSAAGFTILCEER